MPAELRSTGLRIRHRHHGHDEEEAADQHRERQGGIVEDRVGGEARKGAAIVAGGARERIQNLRKPVRAGIIGVRRRRSRRVPVTVLRKFDNRLIADTDWDRYSSRFNERDVMRKFNAVFLA